MAQHGPELPQLSGELFLTDGGIETTLIFHDGLELSHFAAFDLLSTTKAGERWSDISPPMRTLPPGTGSDSFSRAPPGVRARIGGASSAMAMTR